MLDLPSQRPYEVRYLGAAPARLPDNTLACVRFGTGLAAHTDPRVIDVPLAPLGGCRSVELWQSRMPVTHGHQDGFGYAENGELLFGSLHLPESELGAMEHAAFRAYVRTHRLLESRGYHHWLRVWNFIARITEGEGDHERYRQFTLGRWRALSVNPDFEFALPAATAIGSADGGMLIYFMAGKSAGVQIENPRQVSAFRYPREYGPRSPSFTRALLKQWGTQADLMVSGTASIVGHASMHTGDAAAQLRECMNNVTTLVQRAGEQLGPGGAALAAQSFKLYLRDPALAQPLAALAAQQLPAPAMLLHGDICRRDLLLEVEALYTLGDAP